MTKTEQNRVVAWRLKFTPPRLGSQSPGSFRQSDALFHLTVAVNTSSISKLVRQPGAAVWLSRLSVQTGCETPSCETNPR